MLWRRKNLETHIVSYLIWRHIDHLINTYSYQTATIRAVTKLMKFVLLLPYKQPVVLLPGSKGHAAALYIVL